MAASTRDCSDVSEQDLLSPAGRVVMISGASRGIGAAIAQRLIAEGFSLSLGVRRPSETLGKFSAPDRERLLVSRFDALDPASAQAWLDETVKRFSRLDA